MNFRLAVAINEAGNEETVAEHFASCTKFTVCEFDDSKKIIKTESYFNPLSGHHGGTCQLPAYVDQFNVNAIIAGGMGGKAIANFHGFGIEVITAPGLSYTEAVDLYTQGKLTGYEECAGHDHEHGHNC